MIGYAVITTRRGITAASSLRLDAKTAPLSASRFSFSFTCNADTTLAKTITSVITNVCCMTQTSWKQCTIVSERYTLLTRLCPNSTWLVSTRLDKFDFVERVERRSTCRADAFSLYRACRAARLDSLDTSNSTGSTRTTRREQQARLATFVCCVISIL